MSTKLAIYGPNGNINLTRYLDVEEGRGMEPGDPQFREAVITHSLLKVGGTLALENLKVKEQIFPLKLVTDGILRQNFIYDPSYEHDQVGEDPVEWESVLGSGVTLNAFAVSEAFTGPNGSKSLHVKATHPANTTSLVAEARTVNTANPATTHIIPVSPGQTVALQCLLNIVSAASQGMDFWYRWLKADATTQISEHNTAPLSFVGETGEKTLAGITEAAPVETAFLQIGVRAFSNVSGSVWEWFQDEVIAIKSATSVATSGGYFDGDMSRFRWAGAAGDSVSENYVGKEGLAELVQKINLILNTPGAQVEWMDEGATRPTFFDLVSGQIDDEFDYRLGQNNWLKGKLRLFEQPLGYYNRLGARSFMTVGAATINAFGTSPVMVFNASGTIQGDGAALIQAQVAASRPSGFPLQFDAFSILPSPSYIPYIPGPSANGAGWGLGNESTAPGVTYVHFRSGESTLLLWSAEPQTKFSYVGTQRILVAARTPAGATIQPFQLRGPAETTGGVATPLATTAWLLYDLGTITIPSVAFWLGAGHFLSVNSFEMGTFGGSAAVDLGGIIQLPDNNTCWLGGPAASQSAEGHTQTVYDGVSSNVYHGLDMGVPASGVAPSQHNNFRTMTGLVRGRVPELPPSATAPIFAFLHMGLSEANYRLEAHVNVLERTRYVF